MINTIRGVFCEAREWTRDGHFQNYSYVSGFEDRPHQLNVDVQGEVFYNMSLLNTLVRNGSFFPLIIT